MASVHADNCAIELLLFMIQQGAADNGLDLVSSLLGVLNLSAGRTLGSYYPGQVVYDLLLLRSA
jgi:hypothetical protein